MRGKVIAGKLNVRRRPEKDGLKIGVLQQNSLVDILGEMNRWLEIKYNGGSAFVHADFVERIETPKPLKGKVTTSLLNVRSAANSDSDVVGKIAGNTVVDIFSEQGDWLEIRFNEQQAYIHADFVELIERAEKSRKGTITAPTLNVRRQPGIDSDIVGTLVENSEVEILNQVGKWYEINFNGAPAYVRSDFVEAGEEKRALPPATSVFKYLFQNPQLKQIALAPDDLIEPKGSAVAKKVISAWNSYGNLLQTLSDSIAIDAGCAVAVMCVESSGQGFGPDNKIIIRFENHQFWKRWGKNKPDVFNQHFKYDSNKKWEGHEFREQQGSPWQAFHGNQTREWRVLDFARTLDDTAALDSISMGLPQIMGFNHGVIGYETVQQMFENFSTDIRYHIFGLFDFLDKRMITALQENDFEEFAGYYNGTGQAQKYGEWIQNHYDTFKNVIG